MKSSTQTRELLCDLLTDPNFHWGIFGSVRTNKPGERLQGIVGWPSATFASPTLNNHEVIVSLSAGPKGITMEKNAETVEAWIDTHLGGDTRRWLSGWIENDQHLDPDETDLSNWDIANASEYLKARLGDKWEEGTLLEDDDLTAVFGGNAGVGNLFTELMDGYYSEPES